MPNSLHKPDKRNYLGLPTNIKGWSEQKASYPFGMSERFSSGVCSAVWTLLLHLNMVKWFRLHESPLSVTLVMHSIFTLLLPRKSTEIAPSCLRGCGVILNFIQYNCINSYSVSHNVQCAVVDYVWVQKPPVFPTSKLGSFFLLDLDSTLIVLSELRIIPFTFYSFFCDVFPQMGPVTLLHFCSMVTPLCD